MSAINNEDAGTIQTNSSDSEDEMTEDSLYV
jgi:hypothetical protein